MNLFHCSYHKCLTVYYQRVMIKLFNDTLRWSRGYRHFNSDLEAFYQNVGKYRVASVNNHALDLERIGKDFRISRFIRDPRDLVVSGYFYHKRGAEKWCLETTPDNSHMTIRNRTAPSGMPAGQSYASYLQSLSVEDGLMAEIEYRTRHFDSMRGWPEQDPRIKLFRYEDILGNELAVFKEIFDFYELSWLTKKLGLSFAERFSMNRQIGRTEHIRDPKPAQWKQHFTPKVDTFFTERFGDLLERYGYTHS